MEDPIYGLIVDKFITYLNHWADGDAFRYSRSDFETPWTYVIMDDNREDGTFRIIIIELNDGDDGGPSQLYAVLRKYPWRDDPAELFFITQEFDTMPRMVWQDGKFLWDGKEVEDEGPRAVA